LTLFLSESQVGNLLNMKEAVAAVEEAFGREAKGEAVNSSRTRSRAPTAVLNVMHSVLPYLGRGGLKCYMSSPKGTRFLFILFDMKDSTPLAVMGADVLGRYRTGAASGVATKFLYAKSSATVAIFGSGKQALTQVTALAAVTSISEVRVWSPDRAHREIFANGLRDSGFDAKAYDTSRGAAAGAEVASTITSSRLPFLDRKEVESFRHVNICGGNNPGHSEITPAAVGTFDSVVVDDLPQAKVEYGDLILAAAAGTFSWDKAVEIKQVVAGRRAKGRTLFKSGGAALEDVAVASMVYDKAKKAGSLRESEFEFGWSRP
jgi:ornithine cyclodeaminase/alanine dehydrogenase-like protein (mu-crystallin family)